MALLEALESRVLMSVTAAQISAAATAVRSSEAVVKADLKALGLRAKQDAGVIASDLKSLSASATQSALAKTAAGVAVGILTGSGKQLATASAAINKLVGKLVSDEKKLAKKPTSTTIQAQVSADIAALSDKASHALTDFDK